MFSCLAEVLPALAPRRRCAIFGEVSHAKGHIRQALLDTLDSRRGDLPALPLGSTVEGFHNGRALTWGRLLGMFWNCTDNMPGSYCTDLDVEPGSTYARVARRLKADAVA